jgi:hypothetical protein
MDWGIIGYLLLQLDLPNIEVVSGNVPCCSSSNCRGSTSCPNRFHSAEINSGFKNALTIQGFGGAESEGISVLPG